MNAHVRVSTEGGRIVLTIDDWELFDYVGDFLAEQRDIEYEYMVESSDGSRRFFSMYFPTTVDPDSVSAALESLDAEEVERIWRVNNPG